MKSMISVAAIVATIVASGLGALVAPVEARSVSPARSGLSTGEWTGTLSVYAFGTVQSAGSNRTRGVGSIVAIAAPDGVTGSWILDTQAYLLAEPGLLPPELNGLEATVATLGTLRGTYDEVVMEPEGVTIFFPPPLGELELGPEWQLGWGLDAAAIGCTQVSGDFVNSTRDLAPAYGIDFQSLKGTFVLVKSDTIPEPQRVDFERRLQELNRQFMGLFDALVNGGDLAGLANLLEDAESLGRQRQADASCIGGGAIENLLAGEIGLMLTRFIERAERGVPDEQLSPADWNRLLTAARRTGVMQSDQFASGAERSRLAAVLDDLITAETARLGGRDDASARTALAQIGLGATAAGLTPQATAAFGALG